jgi:glycosyltransferase involved in cell wall biosynthesis
VARGLFIEPFHGGSHRAFLEGLVRHTSFAWEVLALPPGEWRRRMRRGAQELAAAFEGLAGTFDFVVATDMLDLATFLALTRRRLSGTPVMAYFHENQVTYPRLRGTKLNSWFGQINYHTALAADVVGFNSAFHRGDLLGALRELEREPNNWLTPAGIDAIEAKSGVLPVGVDLGWLAGPDLRGGGPRTLLWNHRWEFDKSPELFERVVRRLAEEGVAFRLIVAGEPGDNPSPAMWRVREALPERIVHFGFAESRAEYAELLRRADIAVSTTRHEFFGVGMVEALAAGCIPCAPRRYAYPELVPASYHWLLWEDEAGLTALLRELLTGPLPPREPFREAARRYGWEAVGPAWQAALDALAAGQFRGAEPWA